MNKKLSVRWLAMLLAVVLCLGYLQPLGALAADEPGVADYQSFLSNLKVLEQYADEYAATNSRYNAKTLVVNFIRTGVDRYNDDNWVTLAGAEITDFVRYVENRDAAKGTTAMLLRNIIIDEFTLPNGNQVDFGHMFGTLNIAFVASQESADLGGWAGDICDLLFYSKNFGNVPAGTVEERVAYIKNNCFGVNADDAFGMDDFYGDMDAYYLWHKSVAGEKLSVVMENYFTADLSDSDRAAYFLNNRFRGVKTQEDVRTAVYDTYTANMGLRVLEAKRELSGESELRAASCYAFADYLYEQAGDRLTGDVGGNEGGEGGEGGEGPAMDNEYYSVFSSSSSVLAPGIQQTIKYAMTADNKQIVYYVATVDVNRDDVTIMANYRDNDPGKGWGTQRVEDQALALLNKHNNPADTENYIENFNVVVATNADGFNMSTGQPGGLLVMEGKEWYGVDSDGFFAILKDGTAMIGTKEDYATYKDQIQEAVGGFGAVLIRDGEIAVSKNENYTNSRASRTASGITADGKVVMMVLDGRQEPFSAGGSMEEIAQIMLEAGCVEAVNLDGGGSTTYLSKPEGADNLQLVNRPSDGFARSVATSLVAVSTAKSSKEFDHANISSDYDYLTIGTELQLIASGVSNTGNAAPLPEGLVWEVSDSSVGVVSADGVFTALDNGDVKVHLVLNGVVVGTKILHVVVPDNIAFAQERFTAIFGQPITLPVVATYNGNPVAYNEYDVILATDPWDAGMLEGFVFTPDEEAGIRNVLVAALLLSNEEVYAMADIRVYKDGEAVFDFDNVTAGDRELAWVRDIANSHKIDENLFGIVDANKAMDITYVFGLDMQAIGIPEELSSLTHMLPGADVSATAWKFLLQLAERVSTMTEVKIEVQFDADLDVDISDLKVVNEYFYLKSAVLDENNKMIMTCGWYDQTQAIDAETANPICILSGVKATPKADAAWDSKNQLVITNVGQVSYEIYLRASSLYSFAQQPENQAEFGLLPFVNPDDPNEKGAYFGTVYANFNDTFTLDKSLRQGWEKVGDYYRYFVDNEALVGIHYLPSLEDPTVKKFYEFESDGVLNGTVTGMITMEDGLYYAFQGEMMTGWRSVMDETGATYDYYFHPRDGKAVDGKYTIAGYTYTFEDHKLVEGCLVTDSKGTRYLWAGRWLRNQWLEIGGNWYFAGHEWDGYFVTGGMVWVRDFDGKSSHYHLFDENGVFQSQVTGLYHVGNDTYLMKDGVRQSEPGLVLIDGYYYYFCSTDKAVKNCDYWPTRTNGLLPYGIYKFDEQGRMVNPPVVDPDQPDTPDEPSAPAKNGVVDVNGTLYYFINDALQYAAGLVELEDGSYIYVRSNGSLAIGDYWVTNANGLVEQGMYTFGADGKMVIPEEPDVPVDPSEPTEPSEPSEPSEPDQPTEPKPVKNGVVEVNGTLYYYLNDAPQYAAGLVKLADGSYIYVRSNAQLAIGQYWVTNTNGYMSQGMHNFDDSGIMADPPVVEPEQPDTPDTPVEPEVKNGVVNVNGTLYYFIDNVPQYAAGLVKLEDGSFIYVRSSAQLATGAYWVTNHNGYVKEGMYEFDENGIMLNPPVVEPEQPDTPETPDVPAEPEQPDTPVEPEKPEVKNGVVDVNGTLYYYDNGTLGYAYGVIKLTDENGADYLIYVRTAGNLAIGKYWVTNGNGYLKEGMYTFDENGRLYL